MKNLNKILTILGVKGVLCLVSLTIIALALVTYTAILTVSPTRQFTIGTTTSSWTIYINDLDKLRFLPGGTSEPTLNADDPNTYAFKVTTDNSQVCAVKIELAPAVNNSKFSKFQVNVKYWDSSAWADETLYADPTGSTTKPYIDGLTTGDVGYIHQGFPTTRYYLIKVTYSYDKVDETTQMTVNFQYTPLPQNSF
ncbi:MAG: hypothetical protein QW270_08315 [Candidatus Bathyarchaeia archaeon]